MPHQHSDQCVSWAELAMALSDEHHLRWLKRRVEQHRRDAELEAALERMRELVVLLRELEHLVIGTPEATERCLALQREFGELQARCDRLMGLRRAM